MVHRRSGLRDVFAVTGAGDGREHGALQASVEVPEPSPVRDGQRGNGASSLTGDWLRLQQAFNRGAVTVEDSSPPAEGGQRLVDAARPLGQRTDTRVAGEAAVGGEHGPGTVGLSHRGKHRTADVDRVGFPPHVEVDD